MRTSSSQWVTTRWMTPGVIRFACVLAMLVHLVVGVLRIVKGFRPDPPAQSIRYALEIDSWMILSGVVTIVFGFFVVRLIYEVAMSVFRTDARIEELGRWLKGQPAGTQPASLPPDSHPNP